MGWDSVEWHGGWPLHATPSHSTALPYSNIVIEWSIVHRVEYVEWNSMGWDGISPASLNVRVGLNIHILL